MSRHHTDLCACVFCYPQPPPSPGTDERPFWSEQVSDYTARTGQPAPPGWDCQHGEREKQPFTASGPKLL